jgi:hypothetical protein
MFKRILAAGLVVLMVAGGAQASPVPKEKILSDWYHLILKLVRHTATYSPPLASRNFAYLGVTSYEALASGDAKLQSLAGQLNELKPVPGRDAGKTYDESVVLNAALAASTEFYFSNTGPSGQNALKSMAMKMQHEVADGVSADIAARSQSYGEAVAAHIIGWSKTDGGADIKDLGFPEQYKLTEGRAHWVPTNQLGMQQVPLLPEWAKNRTFALPAAKSCDLPAPPEYSEKPGSKFFQEAQEVHDVRAGLTKEQTAIARFWSDDPMLSPTPPGHWVSIVIQIADHDHLSAERTADALARMGVAGADAFIGCWYTKFEYDLVRPITYIKRVIDPKWEALLITPPFPEYPSGHSVLSGASAAVLAHVFGENYAFDDATHIKDNIPARHFANFDAAAKEAALSRLYGGIHFRSAIELGLDEGHCIAQFAIKLKTFR